MSAPRQKGGDALSIARRVLVWYDRYGRKDLPWQHPRTPYRVWISEIMLQQTQVATVIPYFQRFVERFPDVQSLAEASADELMRYWAGLGYYARARNLQKAAKDMVTRHGGELPRDFDALVALPGIGRSTAGAILAQAWGDRYAILDGNVRRLLSRFHAEKGWPGEPKVAARLWSHAEAHLPRRRLADYTQAVMDLGATVCARKPRCEKCPLTSGCKAFASHKVADYPTARPRKARPLRETRMLLLENRDGAILLQQRPPAGIWGGLWCLPEIPAGRTAASYCNEVLGVRTRTSVRELGMIRHGFTHFDLDIRPMRARVRADLPRVMEGSSWLWYKFAPAADLPALPSPVQKLLKDYWSTA